MISDLKNAAAALEKGRTNEALDHLLTAWRTKRAPEIADAIDALAHAFPKVEGDWMTLARSKDAGNVFALLATVIEAGPISALGGRIEVLAERPDDPRIALAFANLALEPPTTSSSNFPVWTAIFASIEKAGDARVIPILKKRLRMKPGASKFWPKLTNWIERALKKLPEAPKLTKEEAAAVAAVVRAAKKAKPAKAAKPAAAAKVKKPVGDPLARALAAVEANDLPACVEALLDGWRERRLAEYAALINRVTALHDEGIACPGGKDAELEKAWHALAAKKRAIDVGRLADSVVDGKVGDVDKRLEEMLTWPADPRIGTSMFLQCINRSISDRARTWGLVADLLVKNVDVRLAPDLAPFAETRGENKARRAAMRKAGPAALAAIAAQPKEASQGELVAFDKLSAALDKRPSAERRFLEAVLAAAPDDHGPVLVYADWLTERGHPRGELIVLQCSDAPDEARMQELVREHTRALLGPAASLPYSVLAHVTRPASFRRGLLKTIELRNWPPNWLFEGHPLLWFLEEVAPGFGDDATAVAVIGTSRSIRSIEATPTLAGRLAASKTPLTIEKLELGHALESGSPFATLLEGIEGPGLSRVKHLELFWGNGEVYQDGIPDVLVASPLFAKLETLIVAGANLATSIAALKKHARTVATLSFQRRHYLDYRLDIALDKQLKPTKLSLHPVDDDVEIDADDAKALVTALTSLKLPAKTKLTVAKGVTFEAAAKKAVAKVLALA